MKDDLIDLQYLLAYLSFPQSVLFFKFIYHLSISFQLFIFLIHLMVVSSFFFMIIFQLFLNLLKQDYTLLRNEMHVSISAAKIMDVSQSFLILSVFFVGFCVLADFIELLSQIWIKAS